MTENVALKVAAPPCAAKAAICCRLAAHKFEEKHKIILRMIVTIRRINCFVDTRLYRAFPCYSFSGVFCAAVPLLLRRRLRGRLALSSGSAFSARRA